MGLKFNSRSRNAKVGGIATTTRSGNYPNVFGTCPDDCPLNQSEFKGTPEIDKDYALALSNAVPYNGISWTYTHFNWSQWFKDFNFNKSSKTVLNFSAKSWAEALDSFQNKIPTVFNIVNPSKWVKIKRKIVAVWCPAEYNEKINCSNCGGRKGPLCARPNRSFIILFKQKKWKKIPCYAYNGMVRSQWIKTAKEATHCRDKDSKLLLGWIKSLPIGSMVRHHIAGDIGKIQGGKKK